MDFALILIDITLQMFEKERAFRARSKHALAVVTTKNNVIIQIIPSNPFRSAYDTPPIYHFVPGT